MIDHALLVDHGAHDVVRHDLDLGDFVRGAETVEEMQEWNARFEGGGMGDEGEVLRFLHRSRAEHRPTGRARGHHVAVIAEDRQCLCGQRSRSDMKYRRRQFAGDFVHVRNHQQQTLRGSEGAAERAGLERAMDRAGRAAFALHLDD